MNLSQPHVKTVLQIAKHVKQQQAPAQNVTPHTILEATTNALNVKTDGRVMALMQRFALSDIIVLTTRKQHVQQEIIVAQKVQQHVLHVVQLAQIVHQQQELAQLAKTEII